MQPLIDAFRHNLGNLGTLDGREGRARFWLYVAGTYVLFQMLSVAVMFPLFFTMMSTASEDVSGFVAKATLIGIGVMMIWALLLLASAVRRLHDRGLTGWLVLLPLPGYAWMMWEMQAWGAALFMPTETLSEDLLFENVLPLLWSGIAFHAMLLLLIVLLALKGQPGINRYGPPVDSEAP